VIISSSNKDHDKKYHRDSHSDSDSNSDSDSDSKGLESPALLVVLKQSK
jgi:hypothetical protein